MCKLSLIMEGGLRPPPQRGRAPSAPAPFVVMFLYIFRVSGSGFVCVFVSAGVGLTCGIPSAKFWEETTWLTKGFFWIRPPFSFLALKLYAFVLV